MIPLTEGNRFVANVSTLCDYIDQKHKKFQNITLHVSSATDRFYTLDWGSGFFSKIVRYVINFFILLKNERCCSNNRATPLNGRVAEILVKDFDAMVSGWEGLLKVLFIERQPHKFRNTFYTNMDDHRKHFAAFSNHLTLIKQTEGNQPTIDEPKTLWNCLVHFQEIVQITKTLPENYKELLTSDFPPNTTHAADIEHCLTLCTQRSKEMYKVLKSVKTTPTPHQSKFASEAYLSAEEIEHLSCALIGQDPSNEATMLSGRHSRTPSQLPEAVRRLHQHNSSKSLHAISEEPNPTSSLQKETA